MPPSAGAGGVPIRFAGVPAGAKKDSEPNLYSKELTLLQKLWHRLVVSFVNLAAQADFDRFSAF